MIPETGGAPGWARAAMRDGPRWETEDDRGGVAGRLVGGDPQVADLV